MIKIVKNPAEKMHIQGSKRIYKEARKIARMLESPSFKTRPLDIGRAAVDLVLYCQLARISEKMLQHAPMRMAPEASDEVSKWLGSLTAQIWNMQTDNEHLVRSCLAEIEVICEQVNAHATSQKV